MKNITLTQIIAIGLAIFSMLFGSGNLMYPLVVGMQSGTHVVIGITGFLLTAVVLPMLGLIGMILFDGDYNAFFKRLGHCTGSFLIFCCIMILGPVIAIPRIVTLSHIMIAPFLPADLLGTITPFSSFIFALLFLGLTYLATYRENQIVNLLGYIISPTLLISLITIMITGIVFAQQPLLPQFDMLNLFTTNIIRGYETLDLLAAIFFSSIIIHILKSTLGSISTYDYNTKALALLGFKTSALGVGLLGLVYIGMSTLGIYYGHNLAHVNPGQLFSIISFRVLGNGGAALIGIAVFLACISTAIALAAVTAEYIQITLSNRRISYPIALAVALIACVPLSSGVLNYIFYHNAHNNALDYILSLTGGPILYIGYPVVIALTLCNILYKTIDFKPVKLPVALTFIITTASYFWHYLYN